VKRVRIGIGVEDDYGFPRIRGCLESVQIAEIKSLVAERRPETKSGEMV
jgi:hypothetical protein